VNASGEIVLRAIDALGIDRKKV